MSYLLNTFFAVEGFINKNILGSVRQWLDQAMPNWTRNAIILVTLLGSVVLAFFAPEDLLPYLIALVPLAGGIVLLLRQPEIGLIALLLCCLFLPSPDLPGGLNLPTLFLGGLISLWLLTLTVKRNQVELFYSRSITPLLVLVGVTLLSFAVGQYTWFPFAYHADMPAQIGGLIIILFSAGAYLLVAQQVKDLRWLAIMTWLYVALAFLFIAGWFVPGLGPFTSQIFLTGTTSNSLFWVWLAALAASQALFNSALKPYWRFLLALVVLATVYVSFGLNSGWKSGYLPIFACLGVIAASKSWRLGLLLAIIAAPVILYLSTEAIASDEYSYLTRLDAWAIIFEMIKTNPVTGFGPANYYWYTPFFQIRGYSVPFNSHNQYLDILAQTGIIGLITTFWLAAELFLISWRLKNKLEPGFGRAYAYGILGGLAGMMIGGVLADWFFPFTYNIGFYGFPATIVNWMFLGGLVTLERQAKLK